MVSIWSIEFISTSQDWTSDVTVEYSWLTIEPNTIANKKHPKRVPDSEFLYHWYEPELRQREDRILIIWRNFLALFSTKSTDELVFDKQTICTVESASLHECSSHIWVAGKNCSLPDRELSLCQVWRLWVQFVH